jgi:hypothetical protein
LDGWFLFDMWLALDGVGVLEIGKIFLVHYYDLVWQPAFSFREIYYLKVLDGFWDVLAAGGANVDRLRRGGFRLGGD